MRAKLAGANSAPILIGNNVWALRYPTGTLYEYDATSGAVVQSVDLGTSVAPFASPSTALGLVLVPTSSGVIALKGPSGVSG